MKDDSPDHDGASAPDLSTEHDASAPVSYSVLAVWLASLGGYDLKLLTQYTGPDREHEKKRLVRIGASVLLPAFLSLFTTYCLTSPFVDSSAVRILISAVASVVILAVDCVIVTTLRRNGRAGLAARILLSVCLSIAIADPMVNALFHKTIAAKIETQLTLDRTAEEQSDLEKLQVAESQSTRVSQKLVQDEESLKSLDPVNIAMTHRRQAAAFHDDRINAQRDRKEKQLDEFNRQKNALQQQLTTTEAQIESTLVDLQQERAGKRESKAAGTGPVYRQVQDRAESLRLQKGALENQIATLDARIRTSLDDKYDEAAIDTGTGSDRTYSESGYLTEGEQAQKAGLQAEVAGFNASLANIRTEEAQVRTELAELPARFSLSNRNDPLLQTQALIALMMDSPVMAFKVATFMILFFLLDMAPVLAKLTAKPGYDVYLNSVIARRERKGQPERESYDASVLSSADKRQAGVSDFGTRALQRLSHFRPDPSDSRHIKAAKDQVSVELRAQLDDAIRTLHSTQTEDKQPPLLSWLYAVVKNAWAAFRAKLGT